MHARKKKPNEGERRKGEGEAKGGRSGREGKKRRKQKKNHASAKGERHSNIEKSERAETMASWGWRTTPEKEKKPKGQKKAH